MLVIKWERRSVDDVHFVNVYQPVTAAATEQGSAVGKIGVSENSVQP